MQPPAPHNRLVFLCYRRADGQRIARELVKRLHGRTLPGVASSPEFTNVIEVFLDVEQPANNDYLAFIEGRLAKAHALIYIATAGAAVRRAPVDHVRDELNSWLEARTDAPIVIDPYTSQGEYVPPELLERFPRANRLEFRLDEWSDHAADLREQEIAKAVNRILVSIAIQVDEGAANVVREIERQRAEAERAERRRRIGTWMASLSAAVCSVAFLVVLAAYRQAEAARLEAVKANLQAQFGTTQMVIASANVLKSVIDQAALQVTLDRAERSNEGCELDLAHWSGMADDALQTASEFERRSRESYARARRAGQDTETAKRALTDANGDLDRARATIFLRDAQLAECTEREGAERERSTSLDLRLAAAMGELAETQGRAEAFQAALNSAAAVQGRLEDRVSELEAERGRECETVPDRPAALADAAGAGSDKSMEADGRE